MAVTSQQLTQLYLAYFGRPPDFDGMVYYTTHPDLDIWAVAASFSASPESVALYGPTFNAAQINAIYQNLFNRDAEPAGLLYWSQEVALGHLTPGGVAYAILLGAQNDDLVTVQNKLGVATDWFAHLNTSAEITGYAGDDAAAVARAFLHTVDSTPASVTAAEAGLDAAIADAVDANLPPTFALSVDAPTVAEGNSGTKLLTFTLTLDHASDSPLTVNYQTLTNGTATAGEDFQTAAGTVTFAAGQTVATVSVNVLGDTTFESAESVHVQFSGSALTSAVTATGTIANDDVDPATLVYVVSANAPTVTEGDTGTKTLTFTISLDVPAVQAVMVNYQTLLTGTATSGDDFEGTAGVITFAAGQQTAVVNVVVGSDVTVESAETVLLQITGAQLTNSGYIATGTIVDNDITPQLTTGIDTINVVGTGTNIVKGVVDGTTPSNSTFSVGDTIHGNGLTEVQLAVAVGGTGAFAYMNDIASVDIIAGVGSAISFNAIEWDRVGAVNLMGGVNGLTVHITSLEQGVDLTIDPAVGGQLSATFQTGLYADIWNFGKGGASLIDGDVNIDVSNSASAGAYFSASNDLALGDITVGGAADNAAVTVSAIMFNNADVSVGAVAIDVGDSSTAYMHLSTTGSGDVAVSSIGMVGGDSADMTVSITTTGGDVTVGGVAQVVGDSSADANFYVWGGGAVTIGNIDQTIGNSGASASVEITTTGDADINVGNITQLGGTSASEYAYVYAYGDGNITVGNVTQVAGSSASASIAATGSGDVTVGDITQGVTTSAYAYAFVYADSGDITVGDITQVGGDDAYVSASISNSGDITVGDVVQTVGDAGPSNSAYLYVSGDGVVTVGNVTQTVGDAGYAYASISSTGDIIVGNMTAVGGTSASALAYVFGDANVTVGDVNLSIGDAAGTAGNDWAWFSLTTTGEVSVGDITVVAGVNENAGAQVSNDGGGNVVIGDVHIETAGNTNTLTANTNNAEFFASNLNTTGDLTVGNVEMIVGNTNTGTLTVTLDGTFNESLGNLTVGDIDLTLADKATIAVNIEATQTASTTASATNVVNVGNLTVGDVNVVAGTNAAVSISLDHALWQTMSDVGGDLGNTTVGLVTVAGGVGANVTIDYEISNTVQYTTSGTAALVVKGSVGDVTLGGFDVSVDDGGSITVSVDINADGAIGNVDLGDLKASVGVSGMVNTYSVSVAGESIGNVSVGDIELNIGQNGSATTGIDVYVSATAGGIGDITVGDISVDLGEGGDQQTITLDFTATGDIGAVSIGNVSFVVGVDASADGLVVNVSATAGDIDSFSMGDYTLLMATGAQMSTQLHVDVNAQNIGDVTIGNEMVTIGASASATSTDYVHVTATGDIGNVTFGNIEYYLTGAGANTSSGISRTIDAGGSLGDVAFGDLVMQATAGTSNSFSGGMHINVNGVDGIGDVSFGDVTMMGTTATGAIGMSMNIDATSGDIASFSAGDVVLSSIKQVTATVSVDMQVNLDASGNLGDITLGNADIYAKTGRAFATYNFSASNFVGDVSVGDVVLNADKGWVYYGLTFNAGTFDGTVTVNSIEIGSPDASSTVRLDIGADSGDVSIGNYIIHGDGDALFAASADYDIDVTADNISIGSIAFDVTAAAGVYNVGAALMGFAAATSLTLGTVDFSGYKEAAVGQAGETIDVSTYDGAITVIGTDRGDTITGNDEANTFTGGGGTDTFIFTGVATQDIDATTDARVIDVITDFKAGPLFGETIQVDAQNVGVAYYAEKTASSVDTAITAALSAMQDPVNEADIVSVQVGSDVYVMIDTDGLNHIDTIIKLVGVSNSVLNYADFAVS